MRAYQTLFPSRGLSDFGFPGPRAIQSPNGIHVLPRHHEKRRRRWNNQNAIRKFSISSSHITTPAHLFPLCSTHPSAVAGPDIRNAVKTACLFRNPASSLTPVSQHMQEAAHSDITTVNNLGLKLTSFHITSPSASLQSNTTNDKRKARPHVRNLARNSKKFSPPFRLSFPSTGSVT